jgi:polyphenol oxidase
MTLPRELAGAIALAFPRPEGPPPRSDPDREPPSRSDPDREPPSRSDPDREPSALLSLASEGDMKYGDPLGERNRAAFLASAGADPGRALGISLAHSRNVLFPADADDHRALAAAAGAAGSPEGSVGIDGAAGADGIVLRDPSLVATITVADCMPIWLLDRESGAFGVLHSGWKGTGILAQAALGLARRWGTRASSITVILGPAIGACCYEVPAERARSFAREFGEAAAFERGGAWAIDLRAANIGVARALGIGALLSVEACTSCDGRLGSYRRQGPASFTRMLAACGRFPLVRPIAG